MGQDYKRELMKRYGINPNPRNRTWDDPEHEILALLLDDIRGETRRNKEQITENCEKIDEHEEYITGQKAINIWGRQQEQSWYRRTDIQIQIWLVFLTSIQVLNLLDFI